MNIKRDVIFIVFLLFLIPLLSAAQDTLGTIALGEDISITQVCGDCTFNNISSITYPNSTEINGMNDVAMVKASTKFTYELKGANITELGTYYVNGIGNLGGTNTAWVVPFTVTKSGAEINTASLIGYGLILALMLSVSIFFLVFSRMTENPGIKLFLIMIGFAILLMMIGTGIVTAQNFDIQSSTTNMVTYLMFLTTMIFIVVMFYIFIQQTRRALALMKARKGFIDEDDIGF